jgi:hypothetical protein
MELLRGHDLLQVMRQGPSMTLEAKINAVVQVLDGLAHAHHVGVVHRDIKPANLFLTDDGTVKIMDFGVARFTMSASTSEGGLMGSPDYMSPEQVQGLKVDARTDLWSVGCVLHQLLTDRKPFAADTLMTIFYKIMHDDPSPDLPAGPEFDALRPIIGRALTRDLEGRYQSARELAADLRACLAAPRPAAPAGQPQAPPPVAAAPSAPVPPPRTAPDAPGDPTPLFALMRDIYVGAKSGHLHFTHGRQRRGLMFLRGGILHGTSDVEGEQLGHVLVRYGFISQATLQQLTPVVLRERRRLGSLLEEQRVLEKARVDEAVGLHVRDLLFTVLDRSDGSFAFEETAPEAMPAADQEAQVAPGQIILEAARRLQAPDVMAAVLGDLHRPLRLSAHARLGLQKLTLSPTDGFLLSRIDGILSAREIFQIIPLPEEDTERSLFALLCTGMVAYAEKAPPARHRPPIEVDRPPAATPAPAPTPAIVWDLEAEEASAPDAGTLRAREAVRLAHRLIAERKLQDAIDLLGPAIESLRGRDQLRARVTLARVYARVPTWVRRAEAMLLDMIQVNPDFAEAHVVLGEVCLNLRQRAPAIAAFRRAIALDPQNAEAAAQLDAMGAAPVTE